MAWEGSTCRGMIVWLEMDFLKRVLPVFADPEKEMEKYKRPYVVVQCHSLNETSSRILVVPLTGVPPTKKSAMNAPIDAVHSPNGKKSWATCCEIIWAGLSDIRGDYKKILPPDAMRKVDRGLRRVLELDADAPPED